MAEIMAWPLNLTTYSYNAQDVMRFMAGKTSGIFGEEGNFQVVAKSGMTVTVQAEGMTGGWLSDGGKYGVSFWNANDIDLTVETADGVNPRKDRVVVSWHIPQQTTVPDVLIRKGTPSASPQPPALVNNGEYVEICLAEINVPAGATEITSYNITDTRLDESLCGLVSMGIEKIPTGGLEAQFMDWFEDLQTNLDGDVAVNLQNQITGHVSDTEVHLRTLTHSKYGTTHNLAGLSGVSGTVSCVFKATAAFNAGDTIRVDNTGYTIQLSNGEDPEDNLFVSGATVAVIVDKGNYRVNFKAGGGLSNSRLALANATAADVAEGKTFYAGNKTLKTGTLVPYKYATGTVRMPLNENPQVGDTVLTISGLSFRPFLLVVRSYEGAQNYPLWDRFLTCVNEPDSDTTLTGFLVNLDLGAGYDDATWPVAMTTQQGGATVRITEDWGAQDIYPANCYYYAVGL